MYDLNYTYLTELEVDTRQSFDDLSDDLLLLDNNAEESQVVDMKSVISSWQNYFWKSTNTNKQRLDVTFTDISIDHAVDLSTDHFGNPLNELEMMTYRELDAFFYSITSWGGSTTNRTWADLSNSLCDAISALQEKYIDIDNVYPVNSMIVSDEKPGPDFGTWEERKNYYISEVFSKSNYNTNPGENTGTSKTLNNINLVPTASSPPTHTHQLQYIPASGSGGSSSKGDAGVTTKVQWSNVRRGTNRGATGYYTGYCLPNSSVYPTVIKTDASVPVGDEGERSADISSTSTFVNPTDASINVAPKTYPLTAVIWERTS